MSFADSWPTLQSTDLGSAHPHQIQTRTLINHKGNTDLRPAFKPHVFLPRHWLCLEFLRAPAVYPSIHPSIHTPAIQPWVWWVRTWSAASASNPTLVGRRSLGCSTVSTQSVGCACRRCPGTRAAYWQSAAHCAVGSPAPSPASPCRGRCGLTLRSGTRY